MPSLLESIALADAVTERAIAGSVGLLHGADRPSRSQAARLRARLEALGMVPLEVVPLDSRWTPEALRGSDVELLVDAGGFGFAEACRLAAFVGVPLLTAAVASPLAGEASVIGLHAGSRLVGVALGRVELRPPGEGAGLVSVGVDGVRFQVRDRERLRVRLVGRREPRRLACTVVGATAVTYQGSELTVETVGRAGSLEVDGHPSGEWGNSLTCRVMAERLRVVPVGR